MTDDLVERLLDWPYQGETMAHEAAARIEQLTAERDEAWAMVAKADTQMGQSLADYLQAKVDTARLREALGAFVAHYPKGINPDLDAACFAARAALKGETNE